ncbi:MAG: hypothetical protein ACRCZ0_12580 [Cetobacterium sp.]
MRAYNSRKMAKERRKAIKGSLRVSLTEKNTGNAVLYKTKKGFDILPKGIYHLSTRRYGDKFHVRCIKYKAV